MLNLASIVSLLRQARTTSGCGIIINEHTLTTAQTREHVDTLGRWFDFIHHDELLDRIGQPRRRPFCLLTFDDGKRSVYATTAPELERLGVPAVFYVTTSFLSDGEPLWFDHYEALLTALGTAPPGLEPDTVKQLPIRLIRERLERACARHGVRADAADDDVRAMSWDEARDLSRRGFTIGAHASAHVVLTRETAADALAGIERSIADVSAQIGRPCPTFAFPNGNYTAALAHHALKCGVRTVMTTEPVWADRQFPVWRLPRLQLFGGQSRLKIDLKVALAATGRVLANPDDTGRLYRQIARLNRDSIRRGAAVPLNVT
jgi:peptidoglycan/xylan/chitin deacetylase (PgdA/CDA1 family)